MVVFPAMEKQRKTVTLVLPLELWKAVKIRAAVEDRGISATVARLLQAGMSASGHAASDELALHRSVVADREVSS